MKHGNETDYDEYMILRKQFGAGTVNSRQMGDAPGVSRRDVQTARDARERGRNFEDRGYTLQQMG